MYEDEGSIDVPGCLICAGILVLGLAAIGFESLSYFSRTGDYQPAPASQPSSQVLRELPHSSGALEAEVTTQPTDSSTRR